MDVREFTNEIAGTVRIFMDENRDLWFFGSEVAASLGYANSADALAKKVDDEDKMVLSYKGCDPEIRDMIWKTNFRSKVLINESGFYTLALSSTLPAAKEFRRWVTHTVLPSIRKDGGYVLGQENLNAGDLAELKEEVQKLAGKVQYLAARRKALRKEAEQLRQDKRNLKHQNRVFRTEAASQIDYCIHLIQECADLEEEIQRLKNILHIRTVPESKGETETEAEKEKKNVYTVDGEGRIIVSGYDF